LARTSKRGDKYIRTLLTAGYCRTAVRGIAHPRRAWVRSLLARKPTKVAAVALANKTARIVT